jgi:hypothetical protein
MPLAEHFKQDGYIEICNNRHGAETFDSLYAFFDEFIEFLQSNPLWSQKLYCAKERFIRSKERSIYCTDFFGFLDESQREGRNQIAFYYSMHFHKFILKNYPEINHVPEIMRFLEACLEIQKPYGNIFVEAAADLGLKTLFSSTDGKPPILLKVIKYFPAYKVAKPHYDGTTFSLFLDSTDNESLLLSSYKTSFCANDFYSPSRKFARENNQNSLLLIPGTLISEFSIDPTPHIVVHSGKIRYAAIAFAMRPHHAPSKNDFTALPHISIE